MIINAEVNLSAVVQDSSPFVLYGMLIHTEFSSQVLTKRYTDFLRFHEKLCCFSHIQLSNGGKLLDRIPKLPGQNLFTKSTSEKVIQERTKDLTSYVKFLIKIIQNLHNYENKPWAYMIRQFLNLPNIEAKENESARKIQKLYKKYIEGVNKSRLLKLEYQNKGYTSSIEQLPDSLIIYIFSFLGISSLFQAGLASKKWEIISRAPILWTKIDLFTNKISLSSTTLEKFCKSSMLQIIDFRYNLQVSSDAASIIAQTCNPLSLKTALFDGCQRFDDYALAMLAEKFCCSLKIEIPEPDLKGGSRGLQVLSLAECRNISDKSMAYIGKLKRLENLNMRGCNITDDGVTLLLNKIKTLKSIDFSGTSVGVGSWKLLKENHIKNMVLNHSNEIQKEIPLLKNTSVQLIDENFEYELIAVYPLTQIPTSHPFKTRSSFTVQRLIYMIQSSIDLKSHQSIQILCGNTILKPHYTLQQVQHDYWDSSTLILQYKLKSKIIHRPSNSWAILPEWTPDNYTQTCMGCGNTFGLFLRKHHCRNCGKVFCNDCSNYRTLIPLSGFTRSPVRVCQSCFIKIKH